MVRFGKRGVFRRSQYWPDQCSAANERFNSARRLDRGFAGDKLKAILDRAEAKDYRDISALLNAGVSLERALGAFAKMYGKDAGLPLRAMGFFKDGDLPSLPKTDQDVLRAARDRVSAIPDVPLTHGSLAP